MTLPLHDQRIVVTRPAHQADNLCHQLQTLGAEVLALPTIDINACHQGLPKELPTVDWVIFISANAVTFGLAQWPTLSQNQIASIGQKTTLALQQHDCTVTCTAPAPFNTEALLQQSPFQDLTKQSVAIIKGTGGRAMLKQTLQQRGASVTEYAVYERVLPSQPNQDVIRYIHQQHIDHVLITSQESLQNFLTLIGHEQASSLHYIVGSKRQQDFALKLGLSNLSYVDNPSDEQFLQYLTR